MARISILDQDPERIELLAELLYKGTGRVEIAETMGVHKDTVSQWRKDDRVQKRVTELMQLRANRILSHTDTAIERKLEKARDGETKISVDQYLRIRDQFRVEAPADTTGGEASKLMQKLMLAANKDPAFAAKLQGVMADDDNTGD